MLFFEGFVGVTTGTDATLASAPLGPGASVVGAAVGTGLATIAGSGVEFLFEDLSFNGMTIQNFLIQDLAVPAIDFSKGIHSGKYQAQFDEWYDGYEFSF